MREHGLAALALLMMQIGCDDPGGAGVQPTSSTIDNDALFPTDGAISETSDTEPATETTAVTTSIDTSSPDVTTSVCSGGCLNATPSAGPLVPFTQLPGTVPPPTLGGGGAPTGEWRLAEVDIFPYGTFVDGFLVTMSNEGDTRGRAVFDGDAMAVELFLDLRIKVTAGEETGEDTGQATVAVGGCHQAADAQIFGQLASCAAGWPAGTTPPSAMGYELSGTELEMAIQLGPEFLIAMLPADQQELASFVIVGPLTLVATMDRP